MTQHRLVHCGVGELLELTARRHPRPAVPAPPTGGRRWFTRLNPPGGAAYSWTGRLPGPQHVVVIWWLEVEPAATGVLAHLTAVPALGSWPVPPPLTLALHAWSARELGALARMARTEARAA